MKKASNFAPEVQERPVRMVVEAQGQHDSQWAAIVSVAAKIGCTAETLRRWVRQHARDTGQREGLTTAEAQRIKELERENRELRKADEILKLALRCVNWTDAGMSAGMGFIGPSLGQIARGVRGPYGCSAGVDVFQYLARAIPAGFAAKKVLPDFRLPGDCECKGFKLPALLGELLH